MLGIYIVRQHNYFHLLPEGTRKLAPWVSAVSHYRLRRNNFPLMNSMRSEVIRVAKTRRGKKVVPVRSYCRRVRGRRRKVQVRPHRRSTPN
jgi:hypothetical protein